jgi:hypothetical protein
MQDTDQVEVEFKDKMARKYKVNYMRKPRNRAEAKLYNQMNKADWYPPRKWPKNWEKAFYAGAGQRRPRGERFALARSFMLNGIEPSVAYQWARMYTIVDKKGHARVCMDDRKTLERQEKDFVKNAYKNPKRYYTSGWYDITSGEYHKGRPYDPYDD